MEMVMPVNYVEMTDEEMIYVEGGGFVGVYIKVSKSTGNRGGDMCGVIAASAVAGVTWQLAAAGPWGAAAAAFLTGSAGLIVANAVKSGKLSIPVGYDIPFVSWSRSITI